MAESRQPLANITKDKLDSLLRFVPKEGHFYWRERRRGVTLEKFFLPAGTVRGKGYRSIEIDGKRYYCHRLVWIHLYGICPPCEVDHIDGNRLNNRPDNLRLVSRAENMINRSKHSNNRSGFKGVQTLRGGKRYSARITRDGKHYHLGQFKTAMEAKAAYDAAALSLFGEFMRAGA